MKINIILRQCGKDDNKKLYFRVRDGRNFDIKASSSLTVLSQYWDSENNRYKKSTPTSVVSDKVQKLINERVRAILTIINSTYDKETADFLWLADAISKGEKMVQPSETPSTQEALSKPVKAKGNLDKTALEYFQIYMETSNFNDWHYQSQIAVMKKVARFEAWQQFKSGDPTYKLYLPFFDKEGTQAYLDYIEHEWELKEQYPEHFAHFKLYADHNIRAMSKNTLTCSAKRLFMFLNWCVRNGFLGQQTYNNVTIDQEVYGTPYYLTIEERDRVWDYDFSYDSRLDYHRDKFIFQCLIGCRHNDLAMMTWNHIVQGEYIEYIPHKNLLHGKTDVVRCPLCDKAKAILERLDPTMPLLFARYCEDNYRKDIKKILQIAGVDRMVTILEQKTRKPVQRPIYEVAASHLARRTFIGNLYKQVHDPALISALTGHSENSKSFARYREIDDDIKRDILKFIQ